MSADYRAVQWTPAFAALVATCALWVAGLHLVAGWREARLDRPQQLAGSGWLSAGLAQTMADGCARVVTPPEGERIAVFRSAGRVFAVSNVCRHQGGPLGEGRIVDGCITCPWFGFQYRPEDGTSPAPYSERIATYRTRIIGGEVFVDPQSAGLGRHTPPSVIPIRSLA